MTYEQIHNLFKQRYNQNNWKQFLGEAFANARLLTTPEILTGIDSNIASQVQKLGYITLNENGIERQIAVYEVTLAQGIILERNRVGLRNLLRKYWKDIDAAFIAYHRPDDSTGSSAKWRFTYVSELTGYDADGEFVKIKTEPKRYTYVLGEGESTRTAAERFTTIANKGSKATLDDVKEAFSVEKLSKAFFDEYKKHYDIFCDFMVSKPNIRQTIFNGDEKGIRDFNKKLLGRIVFLYFIQKKGWLGVPAKSDWGKGDFNFLTQQFENFRNKDLFYQEFLSPLFFETLNQKRDNDIFNYDNSQFVIHNSELIKIPYLNGGLFEEDDKKHRNLIFPANLFKSLFDFFNQYNFTIYEDDPNDHTVAVDPEMLGHIFENLLEDNKDKGAYYTPKEIVHYMCQESLIEYLTTWFENKGYEVVGYIGFDKPDQPKLFSANEGRKGQLVMETDTKGTGKQIDRILIEKLLKKKLDDDDKKLIKKHSAEFHNALDNVKICDPAIGSGAFPMGLLHEIFTAKQTLHTFEHGNTKTFDASAVKLNIIQNSIYGVDIEKGAVDIARLRFWLSLIVDEERPKALPNLDYKIVVGNSLVSKLGDDIIDIDWTLNETSHGLFGADLAKQKGDLLKKISKEQKEFFNPDSDKKKLAADIRKLKIDLLITQLELMVKTQGIETKPTGTNRNLAKQTEIYLQTIGWKNKIKDLQTLKTKQELPLHFFDWKLDFPEVMNEQITSKVGFDIVIGNPPYVSNKDLTDKDSLEIKYKTAKGQYDLFSLFIELSFYLCKENGIHSFIIPDSYVGRSNFAFSREVFFKNSNCKTLLHLNNVFETANVSSLIYLTQYSPKPRENSICYIKSNSVKNWLNNEFSQIHFQQSLILNTNNNRILHLDTEKYKLIQRLLSFDVNIEDCCFLWRGEEIGKKSELIIDANIKGSLPILSGTNVQKYQIKPPVRFIRKSNVVKEIKNYNKEKVLVRQLGENINSTFDLEGHITTQSVYCIASDDFSTKVLTSILNSSIVNFIYQNYFKEKQEFPRILLENIKELPLPKKKEKAFKLIERNVEKILNNKISHKDTSTLEQEIDNLVYKLYELTYDEVKVIDPAFRLSKEEYEAIKLE